ncbi:MULTISPECIES: phospholipase A [Neisseria]|uniref:Phospholipase A1 n=1 Tax=Neisseria musculi TaxID=1815583 RepID=A0A7H1MC64_9NEIS|nr:MULTISPECIES: phospholipase A [Neisseria]MBF0803892.1 phospholipase A [Neisseria sp. 19428wB4_WF04]QNT59229.1 phospholipase A1 family protein [Neisseria musculi]TFU43404.1 phospholipase [Neisseria sp. WF04]
MTWKLFVAAGCGLAAFSCAVFAESGDAALQCTLIRDNALRLACFDKIYAARFPPQTPPVVEKQPPKAVDLVKSVDKSIAKKEPEIVFGQDSGGKGFAQALSDAADAYTPLSLMYDLDQNDVRGILSVREHHPMYLLPAWYNSSPNRRPVSPTRGATSDTRSEDQKRAETKMQVSFKTKLLEDVFRTRSDVWFGYTQTAHWQLWNQGEESAPFRNNDYSPEIFITQPVKAGLPGGGRLRMLGLGFMHQSNGQSRPMSRSWNRLYGMAGMEWGKLTVIPRLWVRAFDPGGDNDDNPDITDYMGYGDVKLQYRFNDKQTVAATMRYNPKTGKGGVQADYTFPIKGKLKAYVQGYHGYGENLLDYNHKHNSIGFGVMLNDWDGF